MGGFSCYNKHVKIIRTKELATMISTCIDRKVAPDDIQDILKLAGDTIASALSRDYTVQINRIGVFTRNKRGWIRMAPSKTMRERHNELRKKHGKK
jgi:nucleoid DNA-binding protein